MAESAPRVLDARDGFFDLKPPPDFYPPDYSLLWLLLGLFALSLLCFVVLMFRKRRSLLPVQSPALAPMQWLAVELERLRAAQASEQITVREFASSLSLTLRGYLERTFSFPATDRTVAETLDQLAPRLATLAANSPSEARQLALKEIKALLRFLERTSFAGRHEERLSINSDALTSALHQTQHTANALEQLLAPAPSAPNASGGADAL